MKSKQKITSTNFWVETPCSLQWKQLSFHRRRLASWPVTRKMAASGEFPKAQGQTSVLQTHVDECLEQNVSSIIYINNVTTRWQAIHICLSKISQEGGYMKIHIPRGSQFEQIKGRGVKRALLRFVASDSVILRHPSLAWAGFCLAYALFRWPDRTPSLLNRVRMSTVTQFSLLHPFFMLKVWNY